MAMTDVEEASLLVNRHLLRQYHTGILLSYPLSQVMRSTLLEVDLLGGLVHEYRHAA
jgi:hypothetical protein